MHQHLTAYRDRVLALFDVSPQMLTQEDLDFIDDAVEVLLLAASRNTPPGMRLLDAALTARALGWALWVGQGQVRLAPEAPAGFTRLGLGVRT